jgi:hypothetical protein
MLDVAIEMTEHELQIGFNYDRDLQKSPFFKLYQQCVAFLKSIEDDVRWRNT